MSNLPPTQTPKRPPEGQQRPTQGQQRPMQGQQRPTQGQQRPMQGQQRPTQGQQRPMQGQQRPTQGQQRPMQGQQRPTQGQPRPRPQGAPQRRQSGSSTGSIMLIAIIAVAVVLVISIIVGVAVMAFNGVFEDIFDSIFDKNDNEYSDGGGDDTPPKKPDGGEDNNGLNLPSTLGLPQKAPSKSYVSTNASSVAAISGISSEAAILVNMDGNVTIAAKNADVRVHPASMTKLMTLIVACENITNVNKLLTVEQWMVDYSDKEEGSGIGLKLGQQVSVEDALYLISYNSDTYACLMIAQYVAGSEKAFVDLMNKKASEIGLTGTHFANTTGLYDDVTNGSGGVANDYTYTTCRDMAAIMNCAMNNTAVKSIITSVSKKIPLYREGKRIPTPKKDNDEPSVLNAYTRWFSHENRFCNDPNISDTSMKAIAGKTGGEDIPSSCFVTVAKNTKTNEQFICVTIGRIDQSGTKISEETSTADTELIYKNYAYGN